MFGQREFRTVKGQNRIYVKTETTDYLIPSFISRKGNLCFQLGETLYCKMKNGFVLMLQGQKWITAEGVTTKARAPQLTTATETPLKKFEYPTPI
jgi:hypothetical protein